MQYNFCFAFGNVFYLTNWLRGSEEAIFDLESEISRNAVQKASCSANQQARGCLCNLERFEVREAHWKANQSRCEGAECKPRKIGGKHSAGQEEQQGPVSYQCHTGVTCLLLGPPTAYIRVRPHALPSVPPKLLWTWEVRVECTRTTRGNPASTSARVTLSTSTPASAMFVQHPQTSPLTRILVLPMRVCIRQTSHRGGSGSSQGRMERARRTRSWPSARSSLDLQVFKSASFVCFYVQEETVDQTDKQKIVLQ